GLCVNLKCVRNALTAKTTALRTFQAFASRTEGASPFLQRMNSFSGPFLPHQKLTSIWLYGN
ncbi:MAG TPA: hypothetical protein DDZ56_02960, partial [Cytophagales bacterium]|nr:hypothetical protein [Cytophagales bacterium]